MTEEKTLKEKIEDVFIEWQLSLDRDAQENVMYDHFDRSLDVVFLKRTNDFDLQSLGTLKEKMRDLEDGYLVSTINVKKF